MPQLDTQVGDAAARFGNTLAAVGTTVLDDQRREQQRIDHERKTQDEALARSRAGDGLLDFEIQSKTAVEGIKDKVQRGELPYERARGELEGVLARVKAPTFGPEHVIVGEQYARGTQRLRFQASTAVDQVIDTAQRSELKTTFTGGLDRLGKLALMPDTSLDDVFAKADAVALSGRAAGIPEAEVAKQVQTFKDNARFQRAQSDLVGARRDMGSLDAFRQRLETGDLAGTLDPDKRIALLKEADTLKFQAQNQRQHALDKREKLAERAVTGATRQIETGLPLTAEGWTGLRATVEGTPYAEDFNRLVTQERETQQVLRMPMADQQKYIQNREAQLQQSGGTLADRANLQRIKTTVENNAKQLAVEPLVAAQRLFGRPVPPLDPNDLLQPGGAGRAAAVFADRSTTLSAMQKQYGSQVGAKPLLPQEASMLTKALDQASPADSTRLFGVLRGAMDDDTYRAVMGQLAPDSPVKARAGMLAAVDRQVTTQSNLIGSDVRVSSARIAETMLAGESILNKTKGQKVDDGQAKSMFVPARGEFSASFADAVGNLYRSRPGAQEGDLQAALAYYVGKAAETGRMSRDPKDIDSKLVKEAITATLGAVVDVNGQGQVKAPLGMTGSDMQSKLRERFADVVKEQGLPPSAIASFEHYGVTNYRRDGQYLLTLAGVPVLGKTGTPLVVDLDPPPLTGTRYRRGPEIPGQALSGKPEGKQ